MTRFLGSPSAWYFVVAIWVICLIEVIIPGFNLNALGIRPRSITGLIGIVASPFLHANLFHILSNTFPLIILPLLVRFSVGREHVVSVMVLGGLGSGLGTWLFGSGGIVVGASGIVYALIGYLFGRAYFSPSIRTWGCAVASLFLYSGALWSFLSFVPYISWAAHFWGFVSGIAIASAYKNK